MANVSRINGFTPVLHFDGSPWNGQVRRYVTGTGDATPIFKGDLVTLAAVTDQPGAVAYQGNVGGTQGVTKATIGASNPVVGVAVGFMINPLNLNSPQYRLASTAIYVLVVDDPTVIFEVQSGAAASPTDLNSNGVVTDNGGSTVTGVSGQFVSAYGTSATNQVKVMGAVQRVDNDITSTNYKILVSLNNHQYSGGTGTAGV
jgi:hypothetical protein